MANLRFRNATRKWEGRSASTIPATLKKLVFDGALFDEFYLVPGGRFLITFHKLFFRVWSLYPSACWTDAPEVNVYYMRDPFSSVAYANVVNGTKIQLLLDGTTKLVSRLSDHQLTSHPAFRSDDDTHEITSLFYIELTIGDGSDVAFSFGKPALIRFLHAGGEDTPNFTIPGDGDIVVFQTTSGITMAWDTAHNHCLGWRPDGLGDDRRDWEVRRSPSSFLCLAS
jgi:hypothetical protein